MCVYSVSGSQLGWFCGGYFTYFSLKLLLCIKSTTNAVFSSFLHAVNADLRPGMKSQVHALPPLPVPCSSCGLGLLDGWPRVKKSLRGQTEGVAGCWEKPSEEEEVEGGRKRGSCLSCLLNSAAIV